MAVFPPPAARGAPRAAVRAPCHARGYDTVVRGARVASSSRRAARLLRIHAHTSSTCLSARAQCRNMLSFRSRAALAARMRASLRASRGVR
ncbi:hypothetical protein EON68_00980 [archaeon]|nr:MAG: hypothetical protein EON68_00980 [archaeon]